MEKRTIVIGDVHGCDVELLELLGKTEAGPNDRVVFAGDLIDRGPDPLACLILAWGIGAECVMGNHDEKLLRWLRHEEKCKVTGKKNPMQKPSPERQKQWEEIGACKDIIEWMRSWPASLYLGSNWVAVHAGFEDIPWEEQAPSQMMRVRFVDEVTGRMATCKDDDDPWSQPKGSVPWATRWKGKNVVYGHAVHSLSKPRVDINGTTECWGIDTGCVFGGKLTALVLPSKEIVQVDAKRQYAKPMVQLAP